MLQYLIVCPLLFLAGFIDAIGGGGGLISIPAYIISGVPVHNAIATNKLSSCMGTGLTTWQYWVNGYIRPKLALLCVAAALVGSPIGAEIALRIDADVFKLLMLVILPVTAFYVLKKKDIGKNEEELSFKKTAVISVAAALIVGMYDGFYGPGTGTFLMLLLTGAAKLDIYTAAGTTKAINLTRNIGSMMIYLLNGKVIFLLGLAAGVFNMAGNFLGARFFRDKGSDIVRPIIMVVLVIFFIKILIEMVG